MANILAYSESEIITVNKIKPKTHLGQVFNYKLCRFNVVRVLIYVYPNPLENSAQVLSC
jgi:hypothetical protein